MSVNRSRPRPPLATYCTLPLKFLDPPLNQLRTQLVHLPYSQARTKDSSSFTTIRRCCKGEPGLYQAFYLTRPRSRLRRTCPVVGVIAQAAVETALVPRVVKLVRAVSLNDSATVPTRHSHSNRFSHSNDRHLDPASRCL